MKLYTDTKFLIVDDQEMYRTDNVKKLIELGFDDSCIDTAVNGADAVKKASDPNSNYEFIITDLVMPEMNGLELIQQLNKIEKYKNTPKLVVSGSYDRSIVIEVAQKGGSSFLVKPVEIKAFAQKLVFCADKSKS